MVGSSQRPPADGSVRKLVVGLLIAIPALLVIAWVVSSLQLPRLTPQQLAELDTDARVARWETSPEAAGFERLRAAGLIIRPDNNAIADTLKTLGSDKASAADVAGAVADGRRLVGKHRLALAALQASLDQPYESPPWRNMVDKAPYFADFRAMTRLLMVEAELARRDGKPGEAARLGAQGMQFGAHLMHGGALIGRLVGHAVQALSRRQLTRVLPQLNDAQARALIAALRDAERRMPPASRTFAEEKVIAQRGLLAVFGDPRFKNANVIGVDTKNLPFHLVWSRRKMWDNLTRTMQAWQTRADGPYRFGSDAPPMPPDVMSQILLPVYVEGRQKELSSRAQNRLLLTAAAMQAYRADQKRYPATLDALVPRCLPTLPGDPFNDDKPFRLRRGDTSAPTLYSIGPDGKDDGGTPILNKTKPDGEPVKQSEVRYTYLTSRADIVWGVNP